MQNFETEYGRKITIPIIFKDVTSGNFVDPSTSGSDTFKVTIMRLENAPDFYTIIAGTDYNGLDWDSSDLKNLIDCNHYNDGKYGLGFPKVGLDFRVFGSYLITVEVTDSNIGSDYQKQEFFIRYKERRGLTFSFPDYTSALTNDVSSLSGLLSLSDSIYTSSVYSNYKTTDIFLNGSTYPLSGDTYLKFRSNGYKLEVFGVDFYTDASSFSGTPSFTIVDESGTNIVATGTVSAGRSGVYVPISGGYDVYYDSAASSEHYLQFYTDTSDLNEIHTVVYFRIVGVLS